MSHRVLAPISQRILGSFFLALFISKKTNICSSLLVPRRPNNGADLEEFLEIHGPSRLVGKAVREIARLASPKTRLSANRADPERILVVKEDQNQASKIISILR